jgi:hypothetical protein
MIYAYAITDPGRAPPLHVRGLDDRPVVLRTVAQVAVACSEHRPGRFAPSADNLWRHETVAEALLNDTDRALLPARFGTTFGNASDLADAITRHTASLSNGLDRVRGCVELSVRVSQRASADTAASPGPAQGDGSGAGRTYMLARLAEERRRRAAEAEAAQVLDRLDVMLAPLARETTHRLTPAPGVLVTAAYLVTRDRATVFAARVRDDMARSLSDLRVACTGPWPPYHFSPSLEPAGVMHV